MRDSWTGEAVVGPSELRFKVGQYEDLIRTVTESGGYGNLVLADCLRRLSLALVIQYIVKHPSEYALVGDILEKDRVRLLDSPAAGNMVTTEIEIAAPSGGWRLSQKRAEVELIFRSNGASLSAEGDRMLLGQTTVSKLLHRRDVNGVLLRLMGDESMERVMLAGFIEFLKRGGTLADIRMDDARPFLRIMEKERVRFQFPPLGINMLGADHIDGLIRWSRHWGGKPIPFAAVVME